MEFTFDNLEKYYRVVLENNYKVITCKEYFEYDKCLNDKLLVNRIDVDFSINKAKRIAQILNKLGIKATFFIRLHASEYNPFAFEAYRILKFIQETGHEIGYHSEVMDQARIWNEDPEICLLRDLDILNRLLDTKILGVASHGGMTGLNNLDFWKNNQPSKYNLLYEAYDQQPEFGLFYNSLYVTDSNWTYWKCYQNSKLQESDHRNFAEHAKCHPDRIYLLLHPSTYYDEHFYE